MATRIELSSADLARVRFAISPVYETVRAVRVLGDPGRSAIHRRAYRRRPPACPTIPISRCCAAGWRGVPISLLPTPDGRQPEIRDELRRVKNANPAAMLARLAATIERCHDALIAPHWPSKTPSIMSPASP
jgi:hypothetical protein